MFVWKRPKINEKEAGVGPFKKKTIYHPLPPQWELVGRKTSCMARQKKPGCPFTDKIGGSDNLLNLQRLWFKSRWLLSTAMVNQKNSMGSGCGSVGSPRFESRHQQSFYWTWTVNYCIENTKIKKKRPGMAHFWKNSNNLNKCWCVFVCSRYLSNLGLQVVRK